MNRLQEITARCKEIDQIQSGIESDAAVLNNGSFTESQKRQYGDLKNEFDRLIAEKRQLESPAPMPRRTQANSGSPLSAGGYSHNVGTFASIHGDNGVAGQVGVFHGGAAKPKTEWSDVKTGEPINTFAPNERFSDRHENAGELSIGRMMQAMATGSWRHAQAERRVLNVLTETSGSHFLIPDELSAQVIDLARANSVVTRWGASSVDMKTDTLRIARQTGDPTFEVKTDNNAFTGSQPTFGDVMLVAKTLGTVVYCSRELAEDCPNFAQVMEGTLARGLGAEMDRLVLRGNGGSDGIQGIKYRTGIGSTSSVGAIEWADVHNAAVAIRSLNIEPNAYICHPEIAGDLDLIQASTAGTWLNAPASLNGVERLVTTGLTTGDILVGDGRRIVLGFRTQARIEMTTEADNTFVKHQAAWKITLRFDCGLTHAAGFHNLTGITT